MSKHTVEKSRRIDARYWARKSIQQQAQALAQELTAAKKCLREGGRPETSGLRLMQWTRGGDIGVTSSMWWGVSAAEGNRITRLLLLPNTVQTSQRLSPKEVCLDWYTKAGKAASVPVLLCPFCGRRCRYLFMAHTCRENGPQVGEFACRTCVPLCYAKQLRYRSAWLKTWDTLQSLSAKARRYPERLTAEDVAKAGVASDAFAQIGKRYLDRLLAPLDLPEFASEADMEIDIASVEERDSKEYAALETDKPPKRRGRPSLKRQRQEERLLARLHRESQRQAKPKQPVGRPKTRRAYCRESRRASGCGGSLAENEAYCVACRAVRSLMEAVPFRASNGREGAKGRCAVCGRSLCRMGAQVHLASSTDGAT